MTFSPDDRSAYMPPPPANQDLDRDDTPLNIPPLRQTAAEAETRRADLRYRFGGIMVGVAIVAALMGGAFWWGYEFGRESVPAREPPRVAAAPGPVKEAPSDPGGMRVPHQDKLVFDGVTEGGALDQPDRQALGSRPEEPLARPPAVMADSMPRVVEVDKMPPAPPPVAAAPTPTPAPAAPQANMPAAPPPLRDNQLTTLGRLNGATPAPGAPTSITPGAAPAPAAPAVTTPPPAVSTAPLAAPAVTPPSTPPQQTAAVSAPPPPSAAARAGGFKIQLAAHRTVEAAREGWLRVQAGNRDLLGGLEASYASVDLGAGKGVFHRLQAGPFADAASAQSACEALRARNLGCIVVRP